MPRIYSTASSLTFFNEEFMSDNQTVQITGKIVGYKVIDKKAEQTEAKVEVVKPTVGEIKRPERLAGVTYKLTSELAIRIMYEWRREMDEHRVIGQLYYYFGV